jgi:hypothetical protein
MIATRLADSSGLMASPSQLRKDCYQLFAISYLQDREQNSAYRPAWAPLPDM